MGLSRKAEEILSAYGGLKGLAEQPIWLISAVLKTFFSEDERKEILGHLGLLIRSKEKI